MLKIGADPELFVRDTDGKIVSAHDLLPGSKQAPYYLPNRKGAIQVDGTAAEFNIAPANNPEEFSDFILTTIDELVGMIKKKNPGYEVVALPTAEFSDDYFSSLPAEATALGCEPDYNAWTRKMNTPPNPRETFRTGGGHVHLGWLNYGDYLEKEHCIMMTRQLDATLYAFSLSWDDDDKRRDLYGKMGAFRYKPEYGMEYRSLSNAWVRHPDLHKYVFNVVDHAHTLGFALDEWTYQDGVCAEFVTRTLQGEKLTRKELDDYQHYLVDIYGFPRLPDSVGFDTDTYGESSHG